MLGFGETFTMGIIACRIDGIAQQITNGGMVVLPAFVDVGQRVLLIQERTDLLLGQERAFQTNSKFALDHKFIGVVHDLLRAVAHEFFGIARQLGIHLGLQQIIIRHGHLHHLSC